MNVERQRQPRKRDDDEAGASAKQTQKLEDDVLAARKEEVMSRVRRLEQEAGHGVEGKWGESEGAVAVAAASVEGGGTWPHVAKGQATAWHSHSAQCSAKRRHPLCLKKPSGEQAAPWNRPTPSADALRDRCPTMTLAQHHMMELQDIKMRVALSITAALEA